MTVQCIIVHNTDPINLREQYAYCTVLDFRTIRVSNTFRERIKFENRGPLYTVIVTSYTWKHLNLQ